MNLVPDEPVKSIPDDTWPHFELYQRVKSAVGALPIHFNTETYIEGISAIDIFTLNATLGATIEDQVVNTLNQMRTIWDPDGVYSLYSFVRQAQTFPDVLLRNADTKDIIMGIELKGWYLLAKEGEPSFRYQITPAACADADLLVIVPWALKNVISGHPKVFSSYVIPAKYAAELRNHYWRYKRKAKTDPEIVSPEVVFPYPTKSDQIQDRAKSDRGGNFGRYARTGIMDEYLTKAKQEPLCGVPAEYWLHFFKVFVEQRDESKIKEQIEKLRQKVDLTYFKKDNTQQKLISDILDKIEELLK